MEGRRSPLPCEQGRDSSFARIQVPNSSLTDPDWFWDKHIQAKRARVETIVRGMGLSPHPLVPSSTRARDSPSCPEKARERKRKQSLPMQQTPRKPGPAGNQGSRKGGPRVREQLHLLKQQLRRLQEHILQAAEPEPGDTARGPGGAGKWRGPPNVKQRNGYRCGPWARDSDRHQGSRGDLPGVENHRAAEVEFQPEEPRFLPSGTRALLEILRQELTGAVSQAVDSVLQKVLLDPPGRLAQLGRSVQGLVPEGRRETSPEGGACEDPLPPAPAQAGGPSGHLPLAKPLDSPRHPVSPRMTSKPYQAPPATCPLMAPPHIQENQVLSQLLGQGSSGHWSSHLPRDPSSPSHRPVEPALRPWGAVRLRPSAVSRQQPPVPFSPTRWETLPFLPSVKTEQGGLPAVTDALPLPSVHIQEGLNPGHLKKAKLMFFFTRYPSSSLLKAYFPDVQFNRCVSSQMIKWFSNFREFYYIQMEKFARQAISDGVADPEVLVVLRDSELFRALNMHYNKGSDFEGPGLSGHQLHSLFLTFSRDCDHKKQLIDDSMEGKNFWSAPVKCSIRMPHIGMGGTATVPDCFLEVASLTLQEFFRAVSAGKDSDPSWKKPIYKVISKLDSDLPEIFKSSSYP